MCSACTVHEQLAIIPISMTRLIATQQYRKSLCNYYLEMDIIEPNQWPPVTVHIHTNLAIITSDFMPRSDTYSRSTIRGSVDDIFKKKEPIAFDKAFPEHLDSKKRHVILVEGRPGIGKSTLMTKASKDWAEGKILKDVELFLLIRLRPFMSKDFLTLKDLLESFHANLVDTDLVSAIHEKVTRESGESVCFAFDGLDEYSSKLEEPNNLVMNLIYGRCLPKASIIMTTRPTTGERFRRKIHLSKNIEIIGFFEEEIGGYIDTHYMKKEGGKAKANQLKDYITDHPNISRMCFLPVYIALIVYLYDIDPTVLPETETGLYYKFTLHTLQRYSSQKNLETFSDLLDKEYEMFKKVCELAFKATVNQDQIFTEDKILQLLNLPEIPPEFSFLLLNKDIMVPNRTGTPMNTFSFIHLTYQEFLAAVHIVDHLSDSEELEIAGEHAEKVHMWVVWKFLCGIHARNAKRTGRRRSDTFAKAFRRIIARSVSADSSDISKRLACLNMAHCAFESQYESFCQDLVALIKGVVNVVDIALNLSDCSALGYVFARAHDKVKKIDFSYCHLGPDGIAAFVQQLEEFSGELTEVDMLR